MRHTCRPQSSPPFPPAATTSVRARLCLLLALGLLAGCGISVEKSNIPYYFGHPLLNESWASPENRPSLTRRSQSRKKTRKSVAAAPRGDKKKPPGSSKDSKRKQERAIQTAPRQELRGNDLRVVRQEMVLSARRLLGIRESFTQDAFLRHLLTVNNLGIGEIPETGTLAWVYKQNRRTAVAGVAPGDILFLGEDEPEYAVVVEKVEGGDRVTFIGYVDGEVQRGVLSLSQRHARRDETSKRILNSFVGRTRPAGSLLMGNISLGGEGGKVATQ